LKRKDILIIVLVAALAGGLLLVSGQLSGSRNGQAGGRLPAVTVTEPPAGQTPAPQAAQPDADGEGAYAALPVPTLAPAQAYLSVQIDQLVYDPIPLLEDNMLELTQADGKRNVVAFTPNSITMHSATCDNQDCVQQGQVTLNNKENRVLMNMIICLPNRVVLSLLDAEEANKQWQQLNAAR